MRYRIRALLLPTQALVINRTESKTRQATNSATQQLTIAVLYGSGTVFTSILMNVFTLLQSFPQCKSYVLVPCTDCKTCFLSGQVMTKKKKRKKIGAQ